MEAIYETPFLSHAPMEPPVSVASVVDGFCEVWAPVQDPQSCRDLVAGYLGYPVDQVRINVTMLGGAFGRKSKPDFVLEAVELSKRRKVPVRVQWSREDDIKHDYYHAASAQYHKAILGENGMPEGWLQRTAFPAIGTTAVIDPSETELEMGLICPIRDGLVISSILSPLTRLSMKWRWLQVRTHWSTGCNC